MIDLNELCKFLVKAKKSTYAAGDDAKKIVETDKSTTLIFEDEDWKYHDNYFGGEPFGGREVVFFKGKPVYIMVYYGQVDKSVLNINGVYKILMNALKLIPEDKPYRGPERYDEGKLSYYNDYTGDIDNFFGEEVIKKNGQEIYKTRYIGGFVDKRR